MIEIILLVIAIIWIVRLELVTNALNKRINDIAIIADSELSEIKENVERLETGDLEEVEEF